MKKYNAVLWDYDGTIIDSNEIIVQSWQHVAKTFLGHEVSLDFIYGTFGRPLCDGFVIFAKEMGLPTDSSFIQKMDDEYSGFQYSKVKDGFPTFPGMGELVRKFHEAGLKQGMVTSRREESLKNSLLKINLTDCFDFLVCSETTEKHKPDPYPAVLCCEKLGVKPEEAIMIGDSIYDVACGNDAGCDSILVGWSKSFDKKACDAYSPATYYVDSAEDIAKIIL